MEKRIKTYSYRERKSGITGRHIVILSKGYYADVSTKLHFRVSKCYWDTGINTHRQAFKALSLSGQKPWYARYEWEEKPY